MKLRPEQLSRHLEQAPAPIYLVHGAEPLLVQEAGDAIRAAARAQGYSERERLSVEPGFDWNRLRLASENLSLFARRRLLELRLGSAKPGEAGGKALAAWAERPPQDTLLLVLCDKLEKSALSSRWLAALERAGVVVQVWPIERRRLPDWIGRRMRAAGLRPAPEAVAWLAERVEGNLLAAVQEIDKLAMLYGSGTVSCEQLRAVVGDSARYSVYDLADAALAGDAARSARILHVLREEGTEPVLIVWVLHKEIRQLALLGFEIRSGTPPETAMARVWEKRKPVTRAALRRLPPAACRRLLSDCARLDRTVKGVEPGDPWNGLLNLSLALAGKPLF